MSGGQGSQGRRPGRNPRDPRLDRPDRPTRPARPPRHHHHGHEGLAERLPWWLRPEPVSRNRSQRPRLEVVGDLIDAAVAVADAEGLEAVSMRRVARELGMGTMSLYWYVEGKDDLFDLMSDHLLGGQLLDESDFVDWRHGLRAIAQKSNQVYDQHPWLISVMGGHRASGPNVIRHVDQSLRVTDGLGLEFDDRMVMLSVIDDFVVGRQRRRLAEEERERRTGQTAQQWFETMRPFIEELIEKERLDHLAAVVAHGPDFAEEDIFDRALEVVLNGIAATFGLDDAAKESRKRS